MPKNFDRKTVVYTLHSLQILYNRVYVIRLESIIKMYIIYNNVRKKFMNMFKVRIRENFYASRPREKTDKII